MKSKSFDNSRHFTKLKSFNPKELVRVTLISVWLPVAVILLVVIRIFGMETGESSASLDRALIYEQLLLVFVISWPCGVPLTLALKKLYPYAHITTYLLGLVLVPLTVYLVFIVALLNPLGMVITALVLSLPVWLLVYILPLFVDRNTE